jgi:hypothetical protein
MMGDPVSAGDVSPRRYSRVVNVWPAPVIALTIINCDETSDHHGQVLVGVRRPSSNPTHPNVVSVPTQRVPEGLAEAIQLMVPKGGSSFQWVGRDGHSPLRYAIDSLLARKLGLGEPLEAGWIDYEAAAASETIGDAEYGAGISERIVMLNCFVRLRGGSEYLDGSSASYSAIEWVEPTRLATALHERDPLAVVPGGDPLELCIHGLCVTSTVALVDSGAVATATT